MDPVIRRLETISRELGQQAFYRAFMDSVQDAVIVCDWQSARIADANRAACRLYGHELEGLRHMVGRELHPRRAWDQVGRISEDLRLTGQAWAPRIEVRRSDGACVWIEFRANRFTVGPYELLISVGRDVSEHVAHERDLEAARDAAIERANTQQRLATMGQLTAGIAHDFNNQLSVILSAAETLAEDLGPDREDLQDLDEAVTCATGITRQLLDFARPDGARSAVVDLAEILPRCGRLAQRVAEDSLRVDWVVAEATPHVRIAPTELHQVVMNLAVNARDAGADRIQLVAAPLAGEVVVEVADDGPGVPEELAERVFEPFYTTKGTEGSGLGLAVSRGIARGAGGDLVLVPGPVGARFRLSLPAARRVGHEHPPSQAEAEASSPRGTLLIVDDRAIVRRSLERYLRRHGFVALTAGSGGDAFALLHERPDIDLVLCDVAMPDMTGPELARRVASQLPGVPFVFMSGHAEPHRLGLEPGVPFLRKPFRLDDVLEALRSAVG